jgi:3-oxoadipate enol-lactonase
MTATVSPPLPPGRFVALPARGRTFVRECPGPLGAPTVLLIHGLAATADINWFGVFAPLKQHFRVVALDLRGHGRGMDPGLWFRLEDCADDIAALAEVLAIERLIAVGYSMGGLVGQLLWRRHRPLVGGLVLCSTARNFRGSLTERVTSVVLPSFEAVVRMTPAFYGMSANLMGDNLFGHIGDESLRRWARSEFARAGLPSIISGARAAAGFTSHDWIGQVDVPTAVLITTQDQVVPPSRQHKLARAIPAAMTFEIDADHGVCLQEPDRFAPVLVEACRAVATAMADRHHPGDRPAQRATAPRPALPTAR